MKPVAEAARLRSHSFGMQSSWNLQSSVVSGKRDCEGSLSGANQDLSPTEMFICSNCAPNTAAAAAYFVDCTWTQTARLVELMPYVEFVVLFYTRKPNASVAWSCCVDAMLQAVIMYSCPPLHLSNAAATGAAVDIIYIARQELDRQRCVSCVVRQTYQIHCVSQVISVLIISRVVESPDAENSYSYSFSVMSIISS